MFSAVAIFCLSCVAWLGRVSFWTLEVDGWISTLVHASWSFYRKPALDQGRQAQRVLLILSLEETAPEVNINTIPSTFIFIIIASLIKKTFEIVKNVANIAIKLMVDNRQCFY